MNFLEAIVVLLGEFSGVTAIVPATRIYGGRLPEDSTDAIDDKLPCIVVRRTGVGGSRGAPYQAVNADIRCYGVDQPAANAVYWAVRTALEALQNVTVSTFAFASAFELVSGQDLVEPLTGGRSLDSVFSTFQFNLYTA